MHIYFDRSPSYAMFDDRIFSCMRNDDIIISFHGSDINVSNILLSSVPPTDPILIDCGCLDRQVARI